MKIQKYEFYKDDWCTLYLGDNREIIPLIEPKSIDLIITDPPYPKEFLYCFSDLSKFGSITLKDGGHLLCYSGQFFLPEVMNRLNERMTYKWTISLLHVRNTILWAGKVLNRWKPIVVMQNGMIKVDRIKLFKDMVESSGRDKRFHEWGQSFGGVNELVKQFSSPGDLILDPFLGGGTTCVVSKIHGRRSIGIEKDKEACEKAAERICGVFKEGRNPKIKGKIVKRKGLLV